MTAWLTGRREGPPPSAVLRFRMMTQDLEALPGGDLVRQGLADLAAGVETVPALLVRIGAPRLRGAGVEVELRLEPNGFPEHRLYELLAEVDPDSAHSRYNAWLRRLVSFERAAECAAH